MKENKIKIIINKPIEEVFEFTTNPQNTHLWIPSIVEGVTEEYPPKINTKYDILRSLKAAVSCAFT